MGMYTPISFALQLVSFWFMDKNAILANSIKQLFTPRIVGLKVGVQRCDGTAVSSHVNIRYLRTPEKRQWMSNLKTVVDSKAAEVIRKTEQIEQLKSSVRKATEHQGIFIKEELGRPHKAHGRENCMRRSAPDFFNISFGVSS